MLNRAHFKLHKYVSLLFIIVLFKINTVSKTEFTFYEFLTFPDKEVVKK